MTTKREEKTSVLSKDIFKMADNAIKSKKIGHSVIVLNFCNNYGKFNSEFSKELAKRFPETEINYELLGKKFLRENPGHAQFIDVDREPEYNRRLIVANIICQNGLKAKFNKRPINYAYLMRSMIEVKRFMLNNFNEENKVKIFIPKLNTRESGIDRKILEILVEDIWNNLEVVQF